MLGPIYSFYEKTVHPTVSHLWDRVPSPPSAKKVALCALVIFGLYKIYRAYQSLHERVTQAEAKAEAASSKHTSLEARVVTLETDLAAEKQKNITLESRVATLERAPVALEQRTRDSESSLDDEEAFYSFDEESSGDEAGSLPKVPGIGVTTPSTIELFKQSFPGAGLNCVIDGQPTTFAAFILQHLIRIDDVSGCEDLGEGKYQLTHRTVKQALFSKLPDDIAPRIRALVEPMLNAPVTFANPMTIQLFEDQDSLGFCFLDQAIKATKEVTIGMGWVSTKTTYSGHLERVCILKAPKSKKTIYVKGEHNSILLASFKDGVLEHQKFVDMLYANLRI